MRYSGLILIALLVSNIVFAQADTYSFSRLDINDLYQSIDAWWMDASEPDILSNVSPEKRKRQMTPVAIGPVAEYLNASFKPL